MIFGKEKDKAIVLDGLTPKVVAISDVNPEQILKHNAHDRHSIVPQLFNSMPMGTCPLPMGVIRSVEAEAYDVAMQEQVDSVTEAKGVGNLQGVIDWKGYLDNKLRFFTKPIFLGRL